MAYGSHYTRLIRWHEPIPQLLVRTRAADITGYPAYDREPMSVLPRNRAASSQHAAAVNDSGDLRVTAMQRPPQQQLLMPQSEMGPCSQPSLATEGLVDGVYATGERVTLIGDAAHPMCEGLRVHYSVCMRGAIGDRLRRRTAYHAIRISGPRVHG